MFGKKNVEKASTPETDQELLELASAPSTAKYPKPKILAIDLEQSAIKQLQNDGWNVMSGTFGRAYKVKKGSGFAPVVTQPQLPNVNEQEIVIVDLYAREMLDAPDGEKHTPDGELDWWAKCSHGSIDPRPRSMLQARPSFDRILNAGGIFIVFAEMVLDQKLVFAKKGYEELNSTQSINVDLYSFLSAFENISVEDDDGTEMFSSDEDPILGKLISQYLHGGKFSCVIKPRYAWRHSAKIFAKNKFGLPVGIVNYGEKRGAVIVLPQISDKTDFLSRIFQEFLPELAPYLFPHVEQGRWTTRPEYEHPSVLTLLAEKKEIEAQARAKIQALEVQIEDERTRNVWQHDLLTGTDWRLVDAVKRALEELGFQKVIDVDEEQDKAGRSRREDLQIHDQLPSLIVDIKGIGGHPADEDALQADKHASIRMREWNRTDVLGLSIINHQRHLPALDREQRMPFRQELLDAAEVRTLGLLTTWDLYRLVRNARKHNWQTEHLKPLLYQRGRINPLPLHYQFVGTVVKVWSDKFGFVVDTRKLQVGDKIALEFPVEFEEINVESMMVDGQNVRVANVGDQLGLLWPTELAKLREGMRVFRIQMEGSE
jgi:hypothetical protein